MSSTAPFSFLLRMSGISKSFPGVRALDSVKLEVGAAEIHAFLGENGAGKSTLLKILSGAHKPDHGSIEFDGKPVHFASPLDAQKAGIVTIYQEFTLAPDMTIAENVFIGREPGSRLFISRSALERQTRMLAERIGLERSPNALVRDLSVAEQQMVEIARALSMSSKLIVMDEPTSALSRTEVQKLFEIIAIDDHSDDNTPQYVLDFAATQGNIRLIELKNYVKLSDNQPFKKRAIEAAIGEAKGELIVTIPVGFVFQAIDSTVQDFIHLENQELGLAAFATKSTFMKTMCIRANRGCPNNGDVFLAQSLASSQLLYLAVFAFEKKLYTQMPCSQLYGLSAITTI